MVRVVRMNMFYRMDLQNCDLKSEFGTKIEKYGRSKQMKNQFEVQNGVSEGLSKTNMTFKNILDSSGVILAQFPYIHVCFHKIDPKSRKYNKKRYLI